MDKIDFLRDEVRCGFYVPTAIKQAWATQLNILSEIDRICRKYNLTYFAEWGTLLGTVRHGGFIPWDDDIDISMMREDYNKFLEVAKEELPEDFAIHNFKTKDNHWLFLARVINKNQICFDKVHLDKNYNFPYIATVDIFVLDYLYADEKKERERCDEVKRIIALADNIVAGKMDKESIEYYCRELENKYSTKIVRGLSNYDLGVCLYELAEKQMARTKYEESDKIGQIFPWILKGRSGLPKEYYESTIRLPFEYTTMPVAANYHKVLSARYGNYMEIHKIWGGHDYPYFEGQKKNLQAVADFKLPEFEYDEKMLRQDTDGAEFYPVGSYKETVFQCKNTIVNYGKNFNSLISEKCFDEVLNTAVECQQIAIELGEYIEQLKGETNTSVVKVVGCLERLCNDLVSFYDSIASYVELNDETETESIEEILGVINKDITDIDTVIAKEILEKKQVLFVANDSKYWSAFEPYYLASCKECEVQVVHVPLLYKDAYGELMMSDEEVEKAVSIEAYDKRLSVISWDVLDLQLMSFDIIYIQCPYDAENPCFTTPQNYYAKELLKNCKELVYVPVFDVDEFTEKDITTVYNTKHYVTMPGVVCADKTVVQSDTIRDVYINIMTNFAGKSTRTIWENKVVSRSKYIQDIGGVLSCNVNENDAEKNKASKKKLLYCIGASDLYEYQDIAQLIDNKMQVMIDNSSNVEVEVLFYPPNLDENKSIEKVKQEIVEKINNKKFNVISKYEEVAVDDFDAYYGCRSPICLEFTRHNKPVMVSDYCV